ncbi:MAG: hypothetical protein IT494_07550 [Gammaproteobacteria bacterium]|nr:hypothetical protein [Gammaproteobacteria bacterium]
MTKEQQSHPLDNTILKIDRLYSDHEADLKMQERMPVDEYADTATGCSLADLINELDDRHSGLSDTQQLEAEAVAAAGATATEEMVIPEPEAEPGAQTTARATPEPAAASRRAGTTSAADDLPDLLREFEARVLAHIDQRLRDGDRRRTLEHAQKVERIRGAAALQLRKKEAALRANYQAKELGLRVHYKKLIALANTIAQQKVQLQQTRKQFDEKLRAAGDLYRQMEEMRGALRDRLETGKGAATANPPPPKS